MYVRPSRFKPVRSVVYYQVGGRLVVGPWTLTPSTQVRILVSQPVVPKCLLQKLNLVDY